MSFTNCSSPTRSRPADWPSVRRLISTVRHSYAHHAKLDRDARTLQGMSDRQLGDIGLRRSDVEGGINPRGSL
jgi:uncharacterized protein YjiS (DUF1127 family)